MAWLQTILILLLGLLKLFGGVHLWWWPGRGRRSR